MTIGFQRISTRGAKVKRRIFLIHFLYDLTICHMLSWPTWPIISTWSALVSLITLGIWLVWKLQQYTAKGLVTFPFLLPIKLKIAKCKVLTKRTFCFLILRAAQAYDKGDCHSRPHPATFLKRVLNNLKMWRKSVANSQNSSQRLRDSVTEIVPLEYKWFLLPLMARITSH